MYPSAVALGSQQELRWRTVSSRELLQLVDSAADQLATRHGIQPGDRVVLWLPNHWRTPVYIFALWKLGAIVVPFDREMNPEAASFERIPLDPSCRLASILPLSHLFELTCGMLYPLAAGAAIHQKARLGPPTLAGGGKPTTTKSSEPDTLHAALEKLNVRRVVRGSILPHVKRSRIEAVVRGLAAHRLVSASGPGRGLQSLRWAVPSGVSRALAEKPLLKCGASACQKPPALAGGVVTTSRAAGPRTLFESSRNNTSRT